MPDRDAEICPVSGAGVYVVPMASEQTTIMVPGPDGGREMRISSPSRVLWPDLGLTKLDLVPWFVQQDGSYLASPWLDLAVDGRHYRLAVESLTFDRGEGNAGPRTLSTIIGQLFSDRP